MTLTLTITLLGVILEDADLLALAVLHDGSLNGSTLNNGSTEGCVLAVQDSQDLLELNGFAGLDGQLLDEEHVALCDLVLLTAGHDDCVHFFFNSFIYGLAVGGGASGRTCRPIQSGLSIISAQMRIVNRFWKKNARKYNKKKRSRESFFQRTRKKATISVAQAKTHPGF